MIRLRRVTVLCVAVIMAMGSFCIAYGEECIADEAAVSEITLTGERIETDQADYYTGDINVNFSADCDAGISRVRLFVDGVEVAASDYTGTGEGIETPQGEVVNAESAAEPGEPAKTADAAEPVTAISDELVIDSKVLPETGAGDFAHIGEIVIEDVNGNTESREFEFFANTASTQTEALKEIKALGATGVSVINADTYLLKVNIGCNVVTVYKKNSEGEYEPIKRMTCSSAKAGYSTPTGTFTIGPEGRRCGKSKWALLSGGTSYAQYLVRFNGGKCFHSVIYQKRERNDRMQIKTYNTLGTCQSGGCVRLRVIDAKWIYDNCPNGTVVEVYKDTKDPGPLGKKEYKKLPTTASGYGWDPTDPDTGNPANGGDGKPMGSIIDSAKQNIAKKRYAISKDRFGYTGKAYRPEVTVEGLVAGRDYKIVYPADCKSVGTHYITIKGINNYRSKVQVPFKIVVARKNITKIYQKSSRQFTVKWEKANSKMRGYRLYYSTDPNFKKNCKKVWVRPNTHNYFRVKGAVRNKYYYVKVRVYMKTSSGARYSLWSDVRKIKLR